MGVTVTAPLACTDLFAAKVVDQFDLDTAVVAQKFAVFHHLIPVVSQSGVGGAAGTEFDVGCVFFKLFGKESELSFCVDLSHEKFVVQPGGKVVFVFQLILLLRDHNIEGFEGTSPLFIECINGFVLLFQVLPEELQTVR